ncbi:MAG: hypothetical protein JJ855_19345 [Rhodospirillales bacterium]|nr:hypothetical protein [Rhodospirillales bacterium]
MATVPKPTAVAPAAPAQSTRAVGAPSRVASVSTSQVDALNAGTNISFDAAASGFQNEQGRSTLSGEGGSSRQKYSDPGFDRLFTADTQVFARIFEDQAPPSSTDRRDKGAARQVNQPVSSVIKTYETNALIISGQQPINGTTFSFNL